MLCYSNRIKQGFRLAQTLVYTVLITQHIACYPERQDTRAIREYRAPEVKDVHDTLHHNLRGPPHPEGVGASNQDSSTSWERDQGDSPENCAILVTQGQG